MNTAKICRLMRIGAGLIVILQFLPTQPVNGRQLLSDKIQKAQNRSSKIANARQEEKIDSANTKFAVLTKKSSAKNKNRAARTTSQKIEKDKITSIFIRANDSKRIQLAILVAYNEALAQNFRAMFGQRVTPLVFSVSTLPHRTAYFDPARLCFEQRGRAWQPKQASNTIDILPLEESGQFGGDLAEDPIQQGVILLPEWFDPQAPMTLRYGDFHYLARFARAE